VASEQHVVTGLMISALATLGNAVIKNTEARDSLTRQAATANGDRPPAAKSDLR
jgi:hypothetical protein